MTTESGKKVQKNHSTSTHGDKTQNPYKALFSHPHVHNTTLWT